MLYNYTVENDEVTCEILLNVVKDYETLATGRYCTGVDIDPVAIQDIIHYDEETGDEIDNPNFDEQTFVAEIKEGLTLHDVEGCDEVDCFEAWDNGSAEKL